MNRNKIQRSNRVEFNVTCVENIENYIDNIENEKSEKANADKLKDEVNDADRKMMR